MPAVLVGHLLERRRAAGTRGCRRSGRPAARRPSSEPNVARDGSRVVQLHEALLRRSADRPRRTRAREGSCHRNPCPRTTRRARRRRRSTAAGSRAAPAMARTPSVYAGALTAHATPAIGADDDHRRQRRPQRHACGPRGEHLPPAGRVFDEPLREPGQHEAEQQQGHAVVDRQTPERHGRRDDDERPVPEVQRVRDVADELRGAQREKARRVPPPLGVRCDDHGGGGERRDRGHVAGERRLPVEPEDHEHAAPRCRPSRARSCRRRCGCAARG